MRTFYNRIRNVATAVSSTSRMHISLEDVVARLANADKNRNSQPRVDDGNVNTAKEIRHDLNNVMES